MSIKFTDDASEKFMVRDITIGQYYNTKSIIHELDSRTKLIITLVYAVALFCCKDLCTFLLATVFLLVYVALSHVPASFIFKGLKPVWILILFTSVFSIFNGDGDVILSVWKLKITTESLASTGIMIFRLAYLIIGSSIMTYTTMPTALTSGLESLMKFLKVFHVPVSDIALMLSITLRFIPILMEELDKIMKAQLSRGADFENGNIIKRIKSYVPIFIPLFVAAIRRASELALAMDARCYNGSEGRTRMKELRFEKADYAAFAVLAVFVLIIILVRVCMS